MTESNTKPRLGFGHRTLAARDLDRLAAFCRDVLGVLRAKLQAAGIDPILQICHGNVWSHYLEDPEGNGVECFVDTPFHVARPFAEGYDLDRSDEEMLEATRKLVESAPEFQPFARWREAFAHKL